MQAPAGRRWTGAVGPWLGIGAAPAALALGAGMGDRHGGAVPVLGLLAGAGLMAALLYTQGLLGLLPPTGEGQTLTALGPAYLPVAGRTVLSVLLAAAMIGWNGFNVGLGAAALASLFGVPVVVTALALEALVVAVSYVGPRLANRVAVVTTVSALVLVAVCVWQLAPSRVPVSGGVSTASVADISALVGYVAVFAVRAPDFSVGLRRRSDLGWCVALLVVPAALAAVAGAGVYLRTGSTDVVAVLAAIPGFAALGLLFVAVAVFVPSLTTTYSGALAIRSVLPGLSTTVAMLMVAVPGAALAATRFDRHLLPWLTTLAAVLPPFIVPMAVEAWRRHRGLHARQVQTVTWLVPGVIAGAMTAFGRAEAPLVGLALAGVLTGVALTARRGAARPV